MKIKKYDFEKKNLKGKSTKSQDIRVEDGKSRKIDDFALFIY